MSLLPARSAVEQGRLSGDCRSGRPVPPLPAAEGDMGLRLAWCAALAGAFAVGCGGDPKADPGQPPSGGPPPSEVAVAIRPAAVSLLPLQTQQFSADVSNAADRSVAEGAGGSIDAMGLYVAPSNSGTFPVVATSRADRKAFAAAVVTVTSLPPQIIINILASQATLEVNRTQRFSAVVSGAADPAVTWSVAEGSAGGTIDGDGVYTAPNAAGTYHVTATSHADPSKSATAEVTVTATPLAVSITIAPDQLQLAYGATARFVATVKNAADTSVTWSVAEGSAGGSVDAQGLYTAPPTCGTYQVVATANADPTKTATATVVVNAPPPEVRVLISPDRAESSTDGSLSFSATVTGSTDTAVAWSVAESNGGTVDANGNYKAPAAAGVYHVVATAHADPTKSASTVECVGGAGRHRAVHHLAAGRRDGHVDAGRRQHHHRYRLLPGAREARHVPRVGLRLRGPFDRDR